MHRIKSLEIPEAFILSYPVHPVYKKFSYNYNKPGATLLLPSTCDIIGTAKEGT
jgi:hypothetical protein